MSKTGLYYLYGDYPSQILGDPEHKDRGVQAPGGSGEKPSVEAVQLKKYFEKKKSGS